MDAGLPANVVTLVQGDGTTAETLMADRNVDAVTLTGSLAAGHAAQTICAGRCAPFQGELGGNNAAIVWSDADLRFAARCVARGGFGSAGQRCTANRRLIVEETCYPEFLQALRDATATMPWGDPLDEETEVGPVISSAALRRIAAVIERAGAAGHDVISPHRDSRSADELLRRGWYVPPTLICCDDPAAEIVQEETFGPVVVIQRAKDWEHAIALCNGVRQGLAAAVFTDSLERQQRFLAEARAGLLKINASTAGAAPDAPFCGWQTSGVGPPEHGAADIEFYTRSQTIYGPPATTLGKTIDVSCTTTSRREGLSNDPR
jgi:acyl-CoA reductase-like NAD-dependent aldehyde dehydrogenase